MRHAISFVASAAVLLFGGTILSTGSAQAESNDEEEASQAPRPRLPVLVEDPDAEGDEDAAKEEGEDAKPARSGPRRPVIVPGAETSKPPAAPPSTPAPAPAAKEEAAKEAAPPEAPPAPLEFQGLPDIGGGEAPRPQQGPVENPSEARTISRIGTFSYTFSVRPGRPQPGEPVEVLWRIQEILHIPDPAYGDRKPIEPVDLHARIQGPDGSLLHRAHALDTPGTFGLHFTPTRAGTYEVQLQRADGRSGHQLQSKIWVGVEPPAPTRARSGEGVEELIAEREPDDRTTASVMAELGRRWMAFERASGTPAGEQALALLQEQVGKVVGKIPDRHQLHAATYDKLARELVERFAAVTPDASLETLQTIQTQSCLRCHTRFRFGLAESVSDWPSFELREDVGSAGPSVQDAAPRGRAPVIPASR